MTDELHRICEAFVAVAKARARKCSNTGTGEESLRLFGSWIEEQRAQLQADASEGMELIQELTKGETCASK